MNFGFNFDCDYDQSTSKNIFANRTLDLNETSESESDLTKDELKRLLYCLESDLKTKEEEITKLKTEKNTALLYDAKYGKLAGNDPFLALRRDSKLTDEVLNERQIGRLYESQLVQLEKLISAQKKMHHKSRQILAATEKRHAKALEELEVEKERKIRYAELGDDVLAFLEKERNKLTQQLDFQMSQLANCQEELSKLETRLQAEREKHKMMVLFLITERKQLLIKVHELRLKSENQPPAPAAQSLLLEELKKEVMFLRQERESLSNSNKILNAENLSLKEVINEQESDLTQLRKKSGNPSKFHSDRASSSSACALPQLTDDGGNRVGSAIIMTNRMAGNSISQSAIAAPRTRLANSSSFPTERSRLPRAPSSPNRTTSSIPRNPSSPTKKVPAMGLGTIRTRLAAPSIEQEFQDLDAALKQIINTPNIVNSVNGPNVAPSSPTKRSSSLPRSEIRKSSDIVAPKMEHRPTPQMGSRIVPPQARPDTGFKLSGTMKKNDAQTLSKGFGK
ncbi:unnamed protein product [Auanema sp. JU1783]|nr:unnamed protein product [Auanema sp. JU1783]